MTQVRLSDAGRAQRHCCRSQRDRLRETGRAMPSGSRRIGTQQPDRFCQECGSVEPQPSFAMHRPLACFGPDAWQDVYQEGGR